MKTQYQKKVFVHLARWYTSQYYGGGSELWATLSEGDKYDMPYTGFSVKLCEIVGETARVSVTQGVHNCPALTSSMVFADKFGDGDVQGELWMQGKEFTGARGDFAMCASGDKNVYEFSVVIEYGVFHMVGVALIESCCEFETDAAGRTWGYAALVSDEKNCWRCSSGQGQLVGSPSFEDWNGPKTVLVTVKCREKSSVVGIEGGDGFLGEMSWPESYGAVYPFVGGGDIHVYRLGGVSWHPQSS